MSSNLGEDHVVDGEDALKSDEVVGEYTDNGDETVNQLEAANESPSRSPSRSPLSQILHEEDLFREDTITAGDGAESRRGAYQKLTEARSVDMDEESTSTAETPKAQLQRPESPLTPDDGPSRRVSFRSRSK